MYTYKLTASGYLVLRNGVPVMEQTFVRGSAFVPFADDVEAELAAIAHCAELEAQAI